MTTAKHLEREAIQNIERWIAARGTTRKHVYTCAGMSRQVFEESMKGHRPFRLREIELIADALGIRFTELIEPIPMRAAA